MKKYITLLFCLVFSFFIFGVISTLSIFAQTPTQACRQVGSINYSGGNRLCACRFWTGSQTRTIQIQLPIYYHLYGLGDFGDTECNRWIIDGRTNASNIDYYLNQSPDDPPVSCEHRPDLDVDVNPKRPDKYEVCACGYNGPNPQVLLRITNYDGLGLGKPSCEQPFLSRLADYDPSINNSPSSSSTTPSRSSSPPASSRQHTGPVINCNKIPGAKFINEPPWCICESTKQPPVGGQCPEAPTNIPFQDACGNTDINVESSIDDNKTCAGQLYCMPDQLKGHACLCPEGMTVGGDDNTTCSCPAGKKKIRSRDNVETSYGDKCVDNTGGGGTSGGGGGSSGGNTSKGGSGSGSSSTGSSSSSAPPVDLSNPNNFEQNNSCVGPVPSQGTPGPTSSQNPSADPNSQNAVGSGLPSASALPSDASVDQTQSSTLQLASRAFAQTQSVLADETNPGFQYHYKTSNGCFAVCSSGGKMTRGPNLPQDDPRCTTAKTTTSNKPANGFACSLQDSGKSDAVGTPIDVKSVELPNRKECKGTTYRHYESCDNPPGEPCNVYWCTASAPTDPITCLLPNGSPNPDESSNPLTPGKSVEECTPDKIGKKVAIVGGDCSELNASEAGTYYKLCPCTSKGIDRDHCENDDPADRTCITRDRPSSIIPPGGTEFCQATTSSQDPKQKTQPKNIGQPVPGSENCNAKCNDGTNECKGHEYCIFSPDGKHYVSDCQCEYDPKGLNRCSGRKTGPAVSALTPTSGLGTPTPTGVGYSITVHVFEDQNGNGRQDRGENDKEGVRIFTNRRTSKEEKSDTTNRRGIAIITELTQDTYLIDVDKVSDFRSLQSLPINVTLTNERKTADVEIALVSTVTPTPSPTITPRPTRESGREGSGGYGSSGGGGGSLGGSRSGSSKPTSTPRPSPTPRTNLVISGTVFVDQNGNGVKDKDKDGKDEKGLGGATVSLNNGRQATTDSSGKFSFTNLSQNNYTVTLSVRNGLKATTTNPVQIQLSSNTTVNFGVAPLTTGSPAPTNSQNPTPTPSQSANTKLFFDVILSGIGNNGNQNPLHNQKTLQATVLDTNNKIISQNSGQVTFDATSGSFKGTLDVGKSLPSGNYLVKVKIQNYLVKLLPGFQSISGGTNQMPQVTLNPGDFNGDNKIDALDYNIMQTCLSDQNSPACGANKEKADTDDNGTVDGTDFTLFLNSMNIGQGD